MSFRVVVGDILRQKTEVIAVPAIMHAGSGPDRTEISIRIFEAANYNGLMKEFGSRPELKPGEHCFTSSFRLEKRSGIRKIAHFFPCRFCDEFHFENLGVYREIINDAYNQNYRSIALMLYSEGYSPELVFDKIKQDINWCTMGRDDLEIILVVPTELVSPMLLLHIEKKGIEYINQSDTEPVSRAEKAENYDMDKEFYTACLNKITNQSEFARTIDCTPSTITRIINKSLKGVPKKSTVLLIAIGLQLNSEERRSFINGAGYAYPADERDNAIEKIIRKESRSPQYIISTLEDMNSDWALIKRRGKSEKRSVLNNEG